MDPLWGDSSSWWTLRGRAADRWRPDSAHYPQQRPLPKPAAPRPAAARPLSRREERFLRGRVNFPSERHVCLFSAAAGVSCDSDWCSSRWDSLQLSARLNDEKWNPSAVTAHVHQGSGCALIVFFKVNLYLLSCASFLDNKRLRPVGKTLHVSCCQRWLSLNVSVSKLNSGWSHIDSVSLSDSAVQQRNSTSRQTATFPVIKRFNTSS